MIFVPGGVVEAVIFTLRPLWWSRLPLPPPPFEVAVVAGRTNAGRRAAVFLFCFVALYFGPVLCLSLPPERLLHFGQHL